MYQNQGRVPYSFTSKLEQLDTHIVAPTVPTQNETEDTKYDSLVVERYLIELGQLNGFETRTEYIRLSPSIVNHRSGKDCCI